MLELDFVALFLAGLLGGGHCAGMCGGVVAAFSSQLPAGPKLPYHLGFNLGRLLGYALIGAILGGLAGITALSQLQSLKSVLFVLANVLLIALGLYIAGWSRWLVRIERIGQPVWQRIQPLLRRLLPIRSVWHTPMIGFLWGWIPCGLVYTASLAALSTGSASKGVGVMLAFGIGTLPNLLLIGLFASRLTQALNYPGVKPSFGLMIMAIGLYRLVGISW
ncbi:MULTISPECIES: sulfite exporter TauE/SafE family protein [Deefgea]|uniref:Sulfite exporter TauE/SafE family protein n=1 Tax=Deefgea chitinilytica TaxID=570276 RepID=A0ABS2C8D4_9NEIS|nr:MULTISPECIES: sulfite exporter TauE/SafE family protein [Deefgea]MBM5570419.1 sulfite exporter TauE/SafE family protein [Deefgea chitinilytica]MBM9887648.1 sulfite exporter TauE/SafE family protein [Deefgea sp. CFH1-16]